MALLDLFFKKSEEELKREDTTNTTTEDNSSFTVDDVLLKALLTGEKITKDKALSLPSVSSSVDEISNIIATLPINLYKETIEEGRKTVEEIIGDDRLYILNSDTGDTLDTFQLKKALVQDYLLDKGAYIYIEKDKNKFISIRYVDAQNVTPLKNIDSIFKDVQIMVDGKIYESYNFLKILRSTKDGVSGKGVIDEVSKAIETAYTNILYELNLVKKGGSKKGFLTSENKLGKEETQALKDAWAKLYSNSSENVVVLNKGLDFKEASNSSVELQLNERKKSLSDEIKDIFHISDDYDKTIKKAVIPILRAIEASLNKDFLLESEKKSFYFAFDTKEIEKGDMKARYQALNIASKWMTKNEIRYMEDLDAIDGLDVIPFGLADVLYDVKNKKYFTPNTGQVTNTQKLSEEGGDENEN